MNKQEIKDDIRLAWNTKKAKDKEFQAGTEKEYQNELRYLQTACGDGDNLGNGEKHIFAENLINWGLSAGDGRVCIVCGKAEEK